MVNTRIGEKWSLFEWTLTSGELLLASAWRTVSLAIRRGICEVAAGGRKLDVGIGGAGRVMTIGLGLLGATGGTTNRGLSLE